MKRAAIASLVAVAGVAAVHLSGLGSAQYGYSTFLGVPLAMGMACGAAGRRFGAARLAVCMGLTLSSLALAASIFVMEGFEGLLCLAMAAPLAVPLALAGTWLAYKASPGIFIAPLLLFTGDFPRPSIPAAAVTSAVEIEAPAETVWRNVIEFPDLAPPREWFFRAGLAYPLRARIQGRGAGAVRRCEFSTGTFVEPVIVWDEPRQLRFAVTHNPEPMRELSPYEIHPAHLRGYFASTQGQFLLTPLANGHTMLTGTTWYRQDLWPGIYWRLWTDAIVHRIHLRVLNHIKRISETI